MIYGWVYLATGCGNSFHHYFYRLNDQIYVGQKARENEWRVIVLEEFLHIALQF